MEIDLKKLDKLIALCRKRGVKVVKVDGLELTLSEEAPIKSNRKQQKTIESSSDAKEAFKASEELTPEQIMFWSSNPGVELPQGTEGVS